MRLQVTKQWIIFAKKADQEAVINWDHNSPTWVKVESSPIRELLKRKIIHAPCQWGVGAINSGKFGSSHLLVDPSLLVQHPRVTTPHLPVGFPSMCLPNPFHSLARIEEKTWLSDCPWGILVSIKFPGWRYHFPVQNHYHQSIMVAIIRTIAIIDISKHRVLERRRN